MWFSIIYLIEPEDLSDKKCVEEKEEQTFTGSHFPVLRHKNKEKRCNQHHGKPKGDDVLRNGECPKKRRDTHNRKDIKDIRSKNVPDGNLRFPPFGRYDAHGHLR